MQDNTSKWLNCFTGNLFTAILTETAITFLQNSSLAGIIMAARNIMERVLEPLRDYTDFLAGIARHNYPFRSSAIYSFY
jgi:hypothetical protein